jgi:hypothetical protein
MSEVIDRRTGVVELSRKVKNTMEFSRRLETGESVRPKSGASSSDVRSIPQTEIAAELAKS